MTTFTATYLQNNESQTLDLPTQVISTPGYKVGNAMQVIPSCPGEPQTYPAIYVDCDKCLILRTPANNGTGCLYLTPDPENLDFCCQYIFDLTCGPARHTFYDPDTCPDLC
ncbi:uncharacterized protein LOC135367069 isoform X2 [Ornithodoros turicata]